MSTYVIGDIQGCLSELKQLLKKIKFSADKDLVWFTGDLVNRGPKSLETLRYVKSMGNNAVSVLGNHDLHMLAIAYNLQKQRPSDTFNTILHARDKDNLIDWVANLPLVHSAYNGQYVLVHAGIYPAWHITQAIQYASEVEQALRSEQRIEFLSNMYGNLPARWDNSLKGTERLRFITNAFTRMRYCTEDLRLELTSSMAPDKQIDGLIPWYKLRNDSPDQQIFFGHWSTLGLTTQKGIHCLDTGCLWGGALSAMKIHQDASQEFTLQQINCNGELSPLP